MPTAILQDLEEFLRLMRQHLDWVQSGRGIQADTVRGEIGRPRYDIDGESLEELLEFDLPVPCISKMLGVSKSTLCRRMQEFCLSARHYSDFRGR